MNTRGRRVFQAVGADTIESITTSANKNIIFIARSKLHSTIFASCLTMSPNSPARHNIPPTQHYYHPRSWAKVISDIHYVKHELTSFGSAIKKIYDSDQSQGRASVQYQKHLIVCFNELNRVYVHSVDSMNYDTVNLTRPPIVTMKGGPQQSLISNKIVLVTLSFDSNDVTANNDEGSNQSNTTAHLLQVYAILLTQPELHHHHLALVWPSSVASTSVIMLSHVSGRHSVHASLSWRGMLAPTLLSLAFIGVFTIDLPHSHPSGVRLSLIDSGNGGGHDNSTNSDYHHHHHHSRYGQSNAHPCDHYPVQRRAMNIDEQNLTLFTATDKCSDNHDQIRSLSSSCFIKSNMQISSNTFDQKKKKKKEDTIIRAHSSDDTTTYLLKPTRKSYNVVLFFFILLSSLYNSINLPSRQSRPKRTTQSISHSKCVSTSVFSFLCCFLIVQTGEFG